MMKGMEGFATRGVGGEEGGWEGRTILPSLEKHLVFRLNVDRRQRMG